MARPLKRACKHPAEGFYQLYKQEVRYSDSQEMAGAVGAAARGAMEAGERDGGQPQADLAGVQGVIWDHAAFPKGKAVGEGGALRS